MRDRGNRDPGRKRNARIPMAEYVEPDGATCGAEYVGPNLEAWADAGYGIGTCSHPPGHKGLHRAPVAGHNREGDHPAGTVTW